MREDVVWRKMTLGPGRKSESVYDEEVNCFEVYREGLCKGDRFYIFS